MQRFMILVLGILGGPLCAVATVAQTPAAASPVISDDFNDNTINASLWTLNQVGVGPTIAETNQRLEITIPANAEETGQGAFGANIGSVFLLRGDFDIQVDYQLLDWPASNGVRVGLSGGAAMERTSLGLPADFPERPWREWYATDFGSGLSFIFFSATSDLSGTLRLVRSGSTITGYYFNSGNWVAVGSSSATTADVPIYLAGWSHDFAFRDQAVQIAFDNFAVNEGQLVAVDVPGGRPAPVAPALGIAPNPATLDATITFALPSDAPASLEVVDLAGRRVYRREIGSRGVGYHAIRLAEVRGLRPGIYLVRLSQGSEVRIHRLAVVR